MTPEDELVRELMRAISSVEPAQQLDAFLSIIASRMAEMPIGCIREIREEILKLIDGGQLSVDQPVVSGTLDLIEGHLALRELGRLDEDGAPDDAGST